MLASAFVTSTDDQATVVPSGDKLRSGGVATTPPEELETKTGNVSINERAGSVAPTVDEPDEAGKEPTHRSVTMFVACLRD
jgi:hypothetical protein